MQKLKEYTNIFPHGSNKLSGKAEERSLRELNKYKDQVWELLQIAYEKIGGIKGCETLDQLIADSDLWKLKSKDGEILAVTIYTFKRGGRKLTAGCAKKTEEGKKALYQIIKDDMEKPERGAWMEVSDGMEHCAFKYSNAGEHVVPRRLAVLNMKDKDFFLPEKQKDENHYIRRIGNEDHEKIMIGNPPISSIDQYLRTIDSDYF